MTGATGGFRARLIRGPDGRLSSIPQPASSPTRPRRDQPSPERERSNRSPRRHQQTNRGDENDENQTPHPSPRRRNRSPSPTPTPPGKRKFDHREEEEEIETSWDRLFVGPPTKKRIQTDVLVHYGRHFGRTKRAFCNIGALIREGIHREQHMMAHQKQLEDLEDLGEYCEHKLFLELLDMCDGLRNRLFSPRCTPGLVAYVADTLAKGINGARSDDLKTLKGAVLDWITPAEGLVPSLSRKTKAGRGFYHDITGRYLCPTDYDWDNPSARANLREGKTKVTGLQWPIFLYDGLKFDKGDMWKGLFRSRIMVQAYRHVFTSPSSAVDGDCRGTRLGNAHIHGMKSVTIPSIAYIATLLRFSLGTASTFCRNDSVTDSQRFYASIVFLLEGEEDDEEPHLIDLLKWWNEQIFPLQVTAAGQHDVPKTSLIAGLVAEKQRKKALGRSRAENAPPQ